MCDDSVGHKHAIRKFEEVLVSRIEQNPGSEDVFVVRISADKKLDFFDFNTALSNSKIIKDLNDEATGFKRANETLKGRFLS